jgi:hypothetical protein
MYRLGRHAGAAQQLQALMLVVVVVLGFFASASCAAEPKCGELASNMKKASAASIWSNQFLAQRFQVTYAVMLSAVSIKIQGTHLPLLALPHILFLTPTLFAVGNNTNRCVVCADSYHLLREQHPTWLALARR